MRYKTWRGGPHIKRPCLKEMESTLSSPPSIGANAATPQHFWDRLAAEYYAKPIDNPEAYEQTLDHARAHLQPSDQVLELGAGTGGTAVRLAPRVARWTATDISPAMLDCARERLGTSGAPTNVELRTLDADLSELSADESPGYDVICAFNLLHLVRDLDASLAAIHRTLRPGGLVISKTPCLGEHSWVVRRVLLPFLRAIGRAPAVGIFDHVQLEQAFARHGFTEVDNRTFAKAPTSRYLVMRSAA